MRDSETSISSRQAAGLGAVRPAAGLGRLGRRATASIVAAASVTATLLALLAPPAGAVTGHNPVGAVDSVTVAPATGMITVTGWAADVDDPTDPLRVEIHDNGPYAIAVIARTYRPDVSVAVPKVGAYHGFTVRFAAKTGLHQVCAIALNHAGGVNTQVGCRTVRVSNDPVGALESAPQQPGGLLVTGYALDPNVAGPVLVRTYLDGRYAAGGQAAIGRPGLQTGYPSAGVNRGFSIFTPAKAGNHTVCAYALNLGAGTVNTRIGCKTVTIAVDPVGSVATIARIELSNVVTVSGWTLDPDTAAPIKVQITSDGVNRQLLTANQAAAGSSASWPRYGTNHGYSAGVSIDGNEHIVCAVALNTLVGKDISLGCSRITTSGTSAPAAPTGLSAWPGSKVISLNWTAARAVASPVTSYEITVVPGNRVITVAGAAVSAPVTGLTNGVTYSFSIRAINALGRSSVAVVIGSPSNIPPQVNPAPVSTSHYVRNITGNAAIDIPLMRKMGAIDASYNPSGHSYLVLLQIGGQDEYSQGVLLSAIARYVSYPTVVSAMKAYLDGYATTQKPYAPLTLAVGTNSDVDVSSSAGASWARNVVNPVAAYATRYSGATVAGANDIEPGFSATASQSRAWVSGYLGATTTKYVFNGSADGCSTSSAGSHCNNGWTAADLQWLSGGAAPTRTISLPQIYNYAMPLQWKNISLTGTSAGRPRIYFGGPLTEVTACGQAGSCGSISNVDAWNRLWSAISSTAATKQSEMPHGTDLRIN